jgi:hypothetical protein
MSTSGSSSLIKSILHKSLAEAVYRDVVTKTSNYYYFLGKTLEWRDDKNPPFPIDSYEYERDVRNNIITLKQIGPTDISFVVQRRNWQSGTIYDMYDDAYSTEIIGLDIISGGQNYTTLPTITITGGGGVGAEYTAVISEGKLIDVDLVSRGYGYVSTPNVVVSGGNGSGAILRAVLNYSYSGSDKLEDSLFYVVTDDFNVYKCLDNNNNSVSTVKPSGSSIESIITSDGYRWKFMYNIPLNLRNKFLTDDYIPVISALTNQFYSNGSLNAVNITNKGSGYTSATISVSGDGFREEDPTFLTSVIISDGGTGYSDPTITITDPVSDASPFSAESQVFLGQKLYNTDFDFYEVASPGILSLSEPSHRRGIVQNGTSALKFIGTRAVATATVSSGIITEINLIGSVREVLIINPGSGYTTPPSAIFSGGGGFAAAGVVKLFNGSVLYVTITNPGYNYTSDPTITFGDQWEDSATVLMGEQYYFSNRLYTVTAAGTFGSTAPTHTSGTASNGTATLAYAGSPATGTVLRRYGAGYSTTPSVIITEEGHSGTEAVASFQTSKSEAKLLPIIESGQIVGVSIDNPGVSYTNAQINVSGDGTGAALTADLNIGNISSLQANNELLTVPGTIECIKIISGGYGYSVANIIIEGDGTGASATSTIDSLTGRITKISITDPGQNYTYAIVTISGNGNGASLRAIISPYGGHGKNSPDELFSRNIMFYNNVSNDLNQGVVVNNDYRQLGIIKNPRAYNSSSRYANTLGSACFLIEAIVNTSAFPRDTAVTLNRTINGESYIKKYLVVTSSSSNVLVQSLDNDIPQINDVFQNINGQTFTASSISLPTIDKYSGQMMFIDNKTGFTPSSEETVSLRTIIKF